ncbi:ribosomal protection-like ABC-F family protein [Tuberibacillus sp. Marseille-P3662]|uniref:ribosomal protection-like ABC-F family protein n=1 Tax=Tuberibacillus sp. Marseille-P3662 TaxID=1965358 RepID=UPI000A1CE540|nr:ABC-F type ribosomal protection protein [Tuberibacillus sp. Marseille-P3662]
MSVFKANGLSMEINGQALFRNVDIEVGAGEHIALFGQNGSGKTTLLNGVLGRHSFDEGRLQRFVPLDEWGWLEQAPTTGANLTTTEFVQSAAKERFELKQQLESLQSQLKDEQSDSLWERYSTVYDRFLQLDGYALESEAEATLQRVKLNPSTWALPFQALSGGQKTRAQLARLMIEKPQFIIMDEPTNHLDGETLSWLEEWLQHYSGAVLFVSHDRRFLDRTAHAIYELTVDGSLRYTGGYTAYQEQKAIERQTQVALHKKQEKKRQELMDAINRYQKWFQQAHQAAGNNPVLKAKAKKNVTRFKAKESELERLENEQVKKPRADSKLKIHLDASEFNARKLLKAEELSFSYDDQPMFERVNLSINRGDRIAVIGPNGSGKTTLLKLLIGALAPTAGKVATHPQTKIGYFAQELGNLNNHQTILDSLLSLPDMTQSEARTLLGCFLFKQDDVFKKMRDLSMGEKCRVAFLKLYLSDANLLVLDEPTNFLDVDTREIIEDILQSYPGGIVLVSHDRYLLSKIANRVIQLNNHTVHDYPGGYDEFMQQAKQLDRGAREQHWENERQRLEMTLTQLMTADTTGMSEAEQREQLNDIRSIRQRIGELEKMLDS